MSGWWSEDTLSVILEFLLMSIQIGHCKLTRCSFLRRLDISASEVSAREDIGSHNRCSRTVEVMHGPVETVSTSLTATIVVYELVQKTSTEEFDVSFSKHLHQSSFSFLKSLGGRIPAWMITTRP
jgi:hypothetical protein